MRAHSIARHSRIRAGRYPAFSGGARLNGSLYLRSLCRRQSIGQCVHRRHRRRYLRADAARCRLRASRAGNSKHDRRGRCRAHLQRQSHRSAAADHGDDRGADHQSAHRSRGDRSSHRCGLGGHRQRKHHAGGARVSVGHCAGGAPAHCSQGATVITNDAITDERSLYSLGSSGSAGGGSLLNVQTFATPGTYTYTPTAGTTKIIVEVQGAGGQGASATSTTSRPGVGVGGGSGAYAKSFLTSGFSGATVIVGAARTPSVTPPVGSPASFFGAILAPGL